MHPSTSRRQFLQTSTAGAILAGVNGTLLGRDDVPEVDRPHHAPRASRLLILSLEGGASHLDLFDEKPELRARHGETLPASYARMPGFARETTDWHLAAPAHPFRTYGRCGMLLSTQLPALGALADHLTLVRSMTTDALEHAPAAQLIRSGSVHGDGVAWADALSRTRPAPPHDLPPSAVLSDLATPNAIGPDASTVSAPFTPTVQDELRASLQTLNQLGHGAEKSSCAHLLAPWLDLHNESDETFEQYGSQGGHALAHQCIRARRLLEAGVHTVELRIHGWDHHRNLASRLSQQCQRFDRPVATLLRDLAQRGLLEETLVVGLTEFGRSPAARSEGRDHHAACFSVFLAGAGVPSGTVIGSSDDFGAMPASQPIHTRDLLATVHHLLGIDVMRERSPTIAPAWSSGRVVPELLA